MHGVQNVLHIPPIFTQPILAQALCVYHHGAAKKIQQCLHACNAEAAAKAAADARVSYQMRLQFNISPASILLMPAQQMSQETRQ